MLPSGWIAVGVLVAAAVLAGGAWLHGRSVGASAVRLEWAEANAVQAEAARLQAQQRARDSQAAAAEYEAGRAAIRAQLEQARVGLRDALSVPACPAGGGDAVQLADVLVPAGAVDRLRQSAGAKPAGD
ncbi:MAG: hypothetical protein LW854_08560 [Rubrivivax sp.]|jgi:hypothetical protein|nr:hypothetical protein [Rubrivivax sp.]